MVPSARSVAGGSRSPPGSRCQRGGPRPVTPRGLARRALPPPQIRHTLAPGPRVLFSEPSPLSASRPSVSREGAGRVPLSDRSLRAGGAAGLRVSKRRQARARSVLFTCRGLRRGAGRRRQDQRGEGSGAERAGAPAERLDMGEERAGSGPEGDAVYHDPSRRPWRRGRRGGRTGRC